MPSFIPSPTKFIARLGLTAMLLVLAANPAIAAPDGAPPPRRSADGGPRQSPDGAPPHSRQGRQHSNDSQPAPGRNAARPNHDTQRWHDAAHGHGRYYPAHGWTVRTLPHRSRFVLWSGVNYGFFDGVWYAPGARGYAVVRPPFGIVVADLPAFRTLVVIGGISYLYANGVYYREHSAGGYEVVSAPPDADTQLAANSAVATNPVRAFVYPRMNQSAEQQAGDEYECHRWAVAQSTFDPTLAATSSAGADMSRRGDYQRARIACLEGRDYTVR